MHNIIKNSMKNRIKSKEKNNIVKHINISFRYLLIIVFLFTFLFACSEKNISETHTNVKEEVIENKEAKNIIKKFKNPEVVKDPKMPSGLRTTWQCVYFGSFPQIEILKTGTELPIDEYALNDDVIYDDELYESIKDKMYNIVNLTYDIQSDQYMCHTIDDVFIFLRADYDEDKGEITSYLNYDEPYNIKANNVTINMDYEDEHLSFVKLDNEKYLFIEEKSKDAEANAKKHFEKRYYKNTSDEHLFKFAPIKWRVVDVEGTILTLVSDKLLTSMKPASRGASSTWEGLDVRFYLNAYDSKSIDKHYKKTGFYDMAFSKKEKEAILKTKIKNAANDYYGTSSGNDTEDYVFIPSNAEVFSTDIAADYGFYNGSGVDDAAKRFRSTIYAKYRGAWWSPVEEYKGNSFWFTRTNGYSDKSISYICDFGYIYSRGMRINVAGAGVLPMIKVDASKVDLHDAGFVSSDEINKNTYRFKNVDEDKTSKTNDEEKVEKENVKKDYEIIEFGTYPQREVVTHEMLNDKSFYLKEGEYILDDDLHKKLDEKVNKKGGEIELDGEKYYADYKKIKTLGVDFHYFKIEPIKWRVLEDTNGKKTLITDMVLDNCEFAWGEEDCTWKESAIIKWLNEDYISTKSFYERAFNEKEKSKILTKTFDNSNMKNNYYFGTSCLMDKDIKNSLNNEYTGEVKVYILSEEDMFYGEKAKVYGFDPSDGVADVNRRFNTTAYARHNGTWFSRKDDENFGNAFYMTRTNGYDRQNIVYVGETGAIYNHGINVSTGDIGFLPMIDIKD